jgi:hypothetical protein
MKSETSGYKFDAEPLNFPYKFLSFKGDDGKNVLELYYLLSGEDVELYETTAVNFLRLKQYLGFYDANWREALRFEEPYIRKVDFSADTWRTQALIEMNSFTVAPGSYSYELQMQDEVSNKLAVYRGGYEVRDYTRKYLMLSDILVSGLIGFENEQSTFRKGEINYSPHMFSKFEQGEEVGLYFELYNLIFNEEGQTRFRVECTLQPFGAEDPSAGRKVVGFFRNLFGADGSSVATAYDYLGNARDQEIYMNLSLGDERPGRYELLVEAKDLNSGHQVNSKVDFWVR